MSEYQHGDDEFIAIDLISGNVILRFPSSMMAFDDPSHYGAWIIEQADRLPALISAWKSVMASKDASRVSDSDAKNWIVVLDKPPPGSQDEVVQLIIQATGWPAETAEVELACGFPITLAAALTLAEALELRGVAIECGLSTEIKSMSTK